MVEYALSLYLEAGAARADIHRDGVWIQRAFPHWVDATSPTAEIGLQRGPWSIGFAELFRIRSSSLATVRDEDYTPGRCLANCDTPARFDGEGGARGIVVRYTYALGNVLLEAGLLAFKPRWAVTVSGWREGGRADAPISPTTTYVADTHWQLAPQIGLAWKSGPVSLHARAYAGVKTTGVWPNSIYSGPVATVSVRYSFP